MHILVVNDDGPPSTHSSPYVHSFVRELQRAGHLVSVCLPHTQRSWIGKAHMVGQTVEPTYYRPPPPSSPAAGFVREAGEPDNAGSVHTRPYRRPAGAATPAPEEWVLLSGTPASCVQVGLYHVFRERPPVDLVVSGPNYGRNTTAVFALSSGTLGGALEAATCRKPAVALSYAFFNRNHDRTIIAEASRHAVRVIEALYRQWPTDGSADLYSVNVPLVAGVSTRKTVYAAILQNYWQAGGCFVAEDAGDDDDEEAEKEGKEGKDVEEERIRAGLEGDGAEKEAVASSSDAAAAGTSGHDHGHTAPITHRHFKWQPQFGDVYRSVDEAPPGNDGWAVREGLTSVTPLKANFCQARTDLQKTELQLDVPAGETRRATSTAAPSSDDTLYALVAYEDPYVQPIILAALQSLVPEDRLRLLTAAAPAAPDEPVSLQQALDAAGVASASPNVLQITPYETIDFDYAARHPASAMVNSYVIRKALIRKHFLAGTVDQWVAKRPQSVLRGHVQRTEAFEVDYAEFLDDALVEAFDLRQSLAENEAEDGRDGRERRQWWILKPSMSDRGQGIRLFSTMDELQAIFDGWEDDDVGSDDDHNDAVAAADLRHFVAQPDIDPPLLLPGTGGRKFHSRVYVLCVGALQVYVHRDMLALFAAKPYTAPWAAAAADGGDDDGDDDDGDDDDTEESAAPDLAAHLTNTCLQDEADKGDSVRRFWDLAEPAGPAEPAASSAASSAEGSSRPCPVKQQIFKQICRVTGEVFEAAAVAAPVHFQPVPYAFEVYGLDFLVSAPPAAAAASSQAPTPTAWLLEVNAFPDFRQTGTGLQAVVAQFWADALRLVVRRRLGGGDDDGEESLGRLVLVKDVDLGRR